MYEFEDEDDERPRRTWLVAALLVLALGGWIGYRQLTDDESGGGSGGGVVLDPVGTDPSESTAVDTSDPGTSAPASTVEPLRPSTSVPAPSSTAVPLTAPRPTTSAVPRPTTTAVPRPTTSAVTVDPTSLESTAPESTVAESTVPESTVVESTVPETTVVESTVPESTIAESTVPETTVAESTTSSTSSSTTTSSTTTSSSTSSTTTTTSSTLPPTSSTLPPTSSTLPPPPPEASRLPDGTPLSALVDFDGDVVTVSGAMPSQQSLDHLLEFVALANTTGKPVENTAIVAPGAVGGDFVRFVGLDPLSFPEGTPVIGPTHAEQLNRLAQLVNGDPTLRVIVLGRSDQRGDDAQNMEVSQRRAEAVVAHLVGQGVDPARVSAIGIGETQPTSTNPDEASYELNRRAEFVVFGFGSPGDSQPVDEPVDTEPAETDPPDTTVA